MPIAIVAITGIVALIVEMLRPRKTNDPVVMVSIAGLLVAAITLIIQLGDADMSTAADMVLRDRFGLCAQLFIVISAAIAILFSEGYLREKRIPFGEFYPLILWSSVGAMMMASTTNLLVLFLGVEILSVALYVMAGMSRNEEKSEESAMKYFLLGAFASGFLLYGIALIYGATGSLSLNRISLIWLRHDQAHQALILLGVAMMLIGLGFKSSLVPFHQWTPDVYQGAPTNVAAFMATGAKIGAFAALYRLLGSIGALSELMVPVLAVVAVVTMFVGNLAALRQRDFKRILGYSSISHAGYILVAMIVNMKHMSGGENTILWYLGSYALMTLGAFAVLSFVAGSGKESTKLEDLHGLAKQSPFLAVCLFIFMASLAGFPLTAGFWGKAVIFLDAYRNGFLWLAVAIGINSIISLYYYAGIIRAAMVDPETDAPVRFPKLNGGLASACAICAVGIVGGFVFYQPVLSFLGSR